MRFLQALAKRAWRDPLVSLVLLTRLPLPTLPKSAFADQAQSVWAFGLVGAPVGWFAVTAGAGALALGLSPDLAAGLVLAVLMFLTGALHEDGLADTADGLWGGRDPARRLEIMRDSRIGTYGMLALIMVTGLRWLAIATLLPVQPLTIISASVLSRAAMPFIMKGLPPARTDGMSAGVGRPTSWTVAMGFSLGTLITSLLIDQVLLVFLAMILTGIVTWAIALLARRKLGGQTGDILGATQQIVEVTLLLAFCATLT